MLERWVKAFDHISRYWAIAGGWMLLALTLYISIDVLLRKMFVVSLQGSDEIGGYVLAIICGFGFSWTLCSRAHIRLNLILPRLPAGARVVVNFLAYIILASFAYAILWWGGAMVIETYELRAVAPTPLSTPLVIPQGIWILGIVWFSFHLTFYVAHILSLLLKKKQSIILAQYGVDSD